MGRATVVLALLLWGLTGHAQDMDLAAEAELHFQLGIDAYLGRQYQQALEHLMLSNRLAPNPSVAFNIGRAYEKLGNYAQAYAYYQAAADGWVGTERVAQAGAAISAIRGRLALVSVVTDPPGAAVFVDRVNLGQRGTTPLTIAVSPGEHSIVVQLDGHEELRTAAIAARRGETQAVSLELAPVLGVVTVLGGPEGAEIRQGGPDGPLLGHVPAELQLPVGVRDLYISAPAHVPVYQQVSVSAERPARLVADLTLITGAVLVDATEVGARITVDGALVGFTPAVLDVVAGEHTVEVSAPGYMPHQETIAVGADQEVSVSAALLPRQEVTAASRRAQLVSEAPASVSIVSAQEIRAFGYQSVWEAAGSVRGAYQTDDLTYQFLGLRGFSIAGDYGNRMLMTLDGHTYNDDLIGASYPAEGLMADLHSVEQIEVVRGPGSALYGSNAFFGVVNVVTPKAPLQDSYAVAAVRDRHVRARAGAGVGDTERGAWASASAAHSQGLDYAFSELDTDGTGGLSLDNDRLRAGTMMARAWAGDAEIQAHYAVRDKQIPTASFETILDDDRANSTDARAFIEARYSPAFGERLRLVSRAYLDQYTFTGAFPYPEEDGGLSQEVWRGVWGGAEPRLIGAVGERLHWTLGGEARVQLVGDFDGTEQVSGYTYLDETLLPRVLSAYTELDAVAAPWLTLVAGGRVDQYSTFGLAASPRLAAVMALSEADTLKLLAGRAFRAPSVYELTYNDNGTTQATATDLGAETIVTVEGEYLRRLGEVTSLSADLFYNQFTGLIDTYRNDDGLYEYANFDDAVRSAGAELEVLRDWRGGWMASASYAYQRTRYGTLASDDQPTNSPAHRGVIKAASPAGPGGVRLASLSRIESPRLTADGSSTEPALLWDLTATGTVRGAVSWSLGVRNLLDWQYSHPGGYDLIQQSVPQRGRNLFVEITHGAASPTPTGTR